MARGDVVNGLATVPAGGNLDFQPPAGVEVLIVAVGSDLWGGTIPNRTPDVTVSLFDGTRASSIWLRAEGTTFGRRPFFITNAIYLRIRNDDATSARNISYSGIRTK